MKALVITALLALAFTTGFTCSKNTPPAETATTTETTTTTTPPAQDQMGTPAPGEGQGTVPAAPTEPTPATGTAPAAPAGETH